MTLAGRPSPADVIRTKLNAFQAALLEAVIETISLVGTAINAIRQPFGQYFGLYA